MKLPTFYRNILQIHAIADLPVIALAMCPTLVLTLRQNDPKTNVLPFIYKGGSYET